MGKKVIFTPLKKLLEGVDELCDAVSSTLGPEGHNVVMYREHNPPYSTKDGVTVAREIIFKDEVKHIGAEMVKQAAIETATQAGDGTTTTLVLAQAILKEAKKRLDDGNSPVMLKKALLYYRDQLVEQITADHKCDDKKYLDIISKIARISSNGDETVSALITEAYKELGKDSILTVERSKTGETYLDKVAGMKFDNGWRHFKFVTDDSSMSCELENPVILVTDYEIKNLEHVESIFSQCVKNQRNLLIISNDIGDLIVKTMIEMQKRYGIQTCAVKSPALNIRRTEMLKDIAALTGATFISRQFGTPLSKVDIKHLGKANKVKVTKYSTSIIEGAGKKEEIRKRIDTINGHLKEVQTTDDAHYKQKLQERKAALEGGFGIIYAGGTSQIAVKELSDRVDDAICATRAALEDGVVYGGGHVFDIMRNTLENDDEASQILREALKMPKEKIWANGHNTAPKNYKSYLKAEGVLDPVKVLKHALYNAIDVACLILITNCLVVNDLEEDSEFKGLPTLDFNPNEKEDDGAV